MTARWILLDSDGLLVDSESISARTLLDLLLKSSIEIDESEVRFRYIGVSRQALCELLVRDHGYVVTPTFWKAYDEQREAAFCSELQPVPGASKFLGALRERGWRLAIATDASRGKTERNLRRLELDRFIDGPLLSAEDLGTSKRSSLYFSNVARQLGAATGELTHVDDRCFAVTSALHAGLAAVGYIGPGSSSSAQDFKPAGVPVGRSLTEVEEHLAACSNA
jgi:beta-phosphoglucomutase-like phosphatase (HAD superfamily)